MKQYFTFNVFSKILFVMCVLLVTTKLNAQVFQKNYTVQGLLPAGAHHFTESVEQTSDGNFVFQGWNLADLLFPKMTLIKINQYSNIMWQRSYTRCAQVLLGNCILEDFTASTIGGCVQQTSDGGFIMTGSLNDKMLLLKTNADGSVVTWAKTYGSGSTYGKFVKQTADGGYICVGYSTDFESTKTASNVFIVKTTSNGTLSWDRVYRISPNYDDQATEVEQLPNNDYVITGYTTEIFPNGDTTTDILLMRLSSGGNLLWAETYGEDNSSEEGQSISKTSDGGYIISGNAEILTGVEPFLWKLNSSDVYEFQNVYKIGSLLSLGITFGYSAQETSVNPGYALFGVTTNFSLTSIVSFSNYMLKLDLNGDTVFCKTYKDSVSGMPINLSQGYSIWNDGQQLTNGGYLIGGCGIPVSGTGLGYKLVKTNTIGESGCSESIVKPIKAVYAPASEPITPPNLSTGSAVAAIDILVKSPNIGEEYLCYGQCTALPGNDTTVCLTGSIQLGGGGPNGETAMNGTPGYSYSWSSNPPGFTSNIDRPIVSPTVTTTYTLTITDSDIPTPCSHSASVIVTISPDPLIHGITSTPQVICQGTSSTLTANADYVTTYTWSPSTGLSSTSGATVTASPSVTTTYTVVASNVCNSVSADVTVTVVAAPQINLPASDSICAGENYTVAGSLSNYASLAWTTSGTGTFNSTTTPNPTYTPSAADTSNGTVTLSVYVTANSVTCNDSTVNINLVIVPIPPAPSFSNVFTPLCENASPMTLTGGTPVGGTYTGPGVSNNQFNPTVAGDGTHTITYTISVLGCTNSSTNTIKVNPLPIVALNSFNNICVSDNPLLLTGGTPTGGDYFGSGVINDSLFSASQAGVGQDTISYVFTDSIGCSDTAFSVITIVPDVTLTSDAPGNSIYVDLGQIVNFTADPDNLGTYVFEVNTVEKQSGTSNLYATNTLMAGNVVYVTLNQACTDSVLINVKPVPNAFIPFGSDAANALFMPNVDLTIINRWGQELYNGTEGWNGKFEEQNVSPGTYFYIIKIVDLSGEEKQFTGTVTLVSK
ncbi:MAG: gliding motility-associated C-terminal domain-containing protein [Bacteroidales bacterium]|nr:gliding motility-associated C-terminal domain-containing protein [Bacteroidales bacterium]